MSEKTGKRGTYYTLAKWYRWACLIIILAPIAIIVMAAVHVGKNGIGVASWEPWFETGISVLGIISAVAAIVFVVLTIIMFFAAGTVRGQASPLGIRIGLLIAICLVLIVGILTAVCGWVEGLQDKKWVQIVFMVSPVLSMAGYITGAVLGSKIKRALA